VLQFPIYGKGTEKGGSILGGHDLWDPLMIGHHGVTGTLAYFGLHPYLHFYGLFFFGIAELTNIPLTIMDVFKYFKDKPLGKAMQMLNAGSRNTFAVSFIILRLAIWPVYSLPFWKGSIALLRGEQDAQSSERMHSTYVVGFFLFANLFLTGLQFFWGKQSIYML
jgi:TLC domain